MYIERVTEIDENILKAFQYFIPELTSEKDRIPTLTLVFYWVPSGVKAWIEDVVVNDKARGKGVATALIWHALNLARENGAEKVDLSSRPWREAANNLYLKFGFEKRETNMYRLYF